MLNEIELLKSFSHENKYFHWYISICSSAIRRNLSRNETKLLFGHVESHHVIPRSFKVSKFNDIVHLSYKEHFICHRLLLKFLKNKEHKKKMAYALLRLITDMKHTSRLYGFYRRELHQNISNTNNPMHGKKHTAETRQMMSLKASGKNNANYGKLAWNHGKTGVQTHSAETKSKISLLKKGKPAHNKGMIPMRLCCVICQKEVDVRNFSRYHKHND